MEPSIRAFLPEGGRFERVRREARALCERYPRQAERPPLFGCLVGVKDLFHVAGWTTHAGSQLPSHVLQGEMGLPRQRVSGHYMRRLPGLQVRRADAVLMESAPARDGQR